MWESCANTHHFEPNLDFQQQAIDAVCDLFRGWEIRRSYFTVKQRAERIITLSG